MFRGREVTHPERGQMILDRLAEELSDLAVVEQRPDLDGRNMTMLLGPSKAVLSGTLDEADGQEEAAQPAAAPQPPAPAPAEAGAPPSPAA
jgi:translation initiation factor IF-3